VVYWKYFCDSTIITLVNIVIAMAARSADCLNLNGDLFRTICLCIPLKGGKNQEDMPAKDTRRELRKDTLPPIDPSSSPHCQMRSFTVKFKAHSKCSALRFEPSHHPPRGNFLQPQPFFTAFHANAREFVAWTSSIGKFHPNHPTDLCKLTFLVTVASVRAHHTVHHKRCVSSH
jgi:hypothetical protein